MMMISALPCKGKRP